MNLLGANRTTSRRWIWQASGARPTAAASFRFGLAHYWFGAKIDRGGDVLASETSGSRVRATVIDSRGKVLAGFTDTAPAGSSPFVVSAIAPDGMAVVAWTVLLRGHQRQMPTVWVRVRRPGQQFGPVLATPAPTNVIRIAVDIGPGGLPEMVLIAGNVSVKVYHLQGDAQGAFGDPVRLWEMDTDAEPDFLWFLAGGPGSGRIVVTDVDLPLAFMRTTNGWSEPQSLPNGSVPGATAALPGGGAAIILHDPFAIVRAPLSQPFGAPQRTEPSQASAAGAGCWGGSEEALSVDAQGDLMLVEGIRLLSDDQGCGTEFNGTPTFGPGGELARVVVRYAPAGEPFADLQTVSPLGTVLRSAALPVGVLAGPGRGLVTWQTGDTAVSDPGALMAAVGAPRASGGQAVSPGRLRMSVSITQRALSAAATGAPLRGSVRCSRRCALHAAFVPVNPPPGVTFALTTLRTLVVGAGRSRTVQWALTSQQRRDAVAALGQAPRQGLVLSAVATDAVGYLKVVNRTLDRPRPTSASAAMTIDGTALLRASHGELTSEHLTTVPPPPWWPAW